MGLSKNEKSIMVKNTTLLLAAVLLFGGCAAVRVSQDFDETTDFTRFQSFDWAPDPIPQSNDILMSSQLMDRRVRRAVENSLTAKGISFTPGQSPDFYVTYHIVVRSRIEADTFSTGFGWYGHPYWGYPYPFWGGIDYRTWIRQYEEGTLIIDFTDARNSMLIWRGIGTRRVAQHSNPERTTAAVNETVSEILSQFPPRPPTR
jgi:hypothetical protein